MLDPTSQVPRLTALILGSAAIGALISSVITILGQFLDRSAKKKELLFSKPIELAQVNVAILTDAAKHGSKSVALRPIVVYTRWHHRELKSHYEKGRLSPRMEAIYKSDILGPDTDTEDD